MHRGATGAPEGFRPGSAEILWGGPGIDSADHPEVADRVRRGQPIVEPLDAGAKGGQAAQPGDREASGQRSGPCCSATPRTSVSFSRIVASTGGAVGAGAGCSAMAPSVEGGEEIGAGGDGAGGSVATGWLGTKTLIVLRAEIPAANSSA